MLGTSPFIGAGQFGKKAELYCNQSFLQPENFIDIVVRAVELGVNAVQVIAYHQALQAVQKRPKRTRTDLFLMGTVGLGSMEPEIEMVLDDGAQAVIVHGSLADRDMPFARQHLANLREQGLVTGIATHRPAMTIPRVEEMEEATLILSRFNKLGTFMHPSVDSTLQALETTSKTIMAMKPLAAGMLRPQEGLSYLSGKVAGVTVGIASVDEAEETFAAAKSCFVPSCTAQRRTNGKHTHQRPASIEHCEGGVGVSHFCRTQRYAPLMTLVRVGSWTVFLPPVHSPHTMALTRPTAPTLALASPTALQPHSDVLGASLPISPGRRLLGFEGRS
jgi:hypothetical protein